MASYPAVVGADTDTDYNRYQAESDLRTLTESKEIEKDPKRMACVRRCAKEKLAEMEAMKKYAEGAK